MPGPVVLVVDDEEKIRRILRGYLESDAIEVVEAASGEDALDRLAERSVDVVILDVMLPGIDGIEVLRRIRTTSTVLVLLLTARADEVDKLVGLSVGADDYVTKPFSPREVVARVKALLRRRGTDAGGPSGDVLAHGPLTVDLSRRSVRVDDQPVELSALEFDLLATLVRSPGRVFSRRQLLEQVWGYDYFGDERVVDVHIRNIRRALHDDAGAPRFVGTVRGVGYRLEEST
jgi:DNA-binding response OmpR family regulator